MLGQIITEVGQEGQFWQKLFDSTVIFIILLKENSLVKCYLIIIEAVMHFNCPVTNDKAI